MKLETTPIEGLFVLHRPVRRDERGFFSRIFGVDEIAAAGRPTQAVHVNTSTSVEVGTLRGIHFQYPRMQRRRSFRARRVASGMLASTCDRGHRQGFSGSAQS